MTSDDPYTPVRIPASRMSTSNRPYYIYSTAVVMLLWSGIYVYLQSQGTVNADLDGVTVSTPARFARRMHEFSAVMIAIFFIASIACVNGALWAVMKMVKR
jgi:hypothetical protein